MKAVLSLVLVCSFMYISTTNLSITRNYFGTDKFDSISFKPIPNSWPVRIVAIREDTHNEGQWIVTTENGMVYYTNELPQVGDTAFYLKN